MEGPNSQDPRATPQQRTGQIDLATVRARLAGKQGPEYWRSLEELAGTPEFEELLHREFPRFASEWPDGVDRRRFLQLMGASVALGGLTACTRQPLEKIVPYVQQPEGLVPGKSLHFATGFELGGSATGVLAESHEGRPTKIEGNPEHPSSLGGTDLFAQGSVLQLYDPDRSQVIRHIGRIGTWQQFFTEVGGSLAEADGGAGIRLLTESISSPTLVDQIERFLARFPGARWITWDAVTRDGERQGLGAAFGTAVAPRYDLGRADVILALDSDFLTQGPGTVRHARDFAAKRRPTAEHREMSRLYAAESTPTGTGTLADHRLSVPPRGVARAALEVARRVGVAGIPAAPPATTQRDTRVQAWATDVAADLQRHPGRCLVVAGEAAPPEVHTLAAAMNVALGAVGSTVTYGERVEAGSDGQLADLTRLVADMREGRVQILLVIGGNPVFDAPADLGFREAQFQVPLRARMGLYEDETSEVCHWHLPQSHYLESWGDARGHDGTATLIQPLIEPLYDTRSPLELLAALTTGSAAAAGEGRRLLADYWAGRLPVPGPDAWRRALHDGLVAGTALPEKAVAVRLGDWAKAAAEPPASGIEVVFRPDPTVGDGRGGNNGWLQELPKPVSKLTWENAVYMSLATAKRLGVRTSSN
ncbi:MAG: TAT-variant-translocated molybdopterin oxidoreductase, partial [Thermoanaerobaculia bacterium]